MPGVLRGMALCPGLVACHGGVYRDQVTPWFRVEVTRPYVLAPHATTLHAGLAWGAEADAEALLDGRWRHLIDATDMLGIAVGDTIALLRVDDADPWLMFRRGSSQPIALLPERCPEIIGDHARGLVICIGCDSPPRRSVGHACPLIGAYALDARGDVRWHVVAHTFDGFRGGVAEATTARGASTLKVDGRCYALDNGQLYHTSRRPWPTPHVEAGACAPEAARL